MKNILYLMHIPWGWIKQRPHFIAEGLNDRYNVKILTLKSYALKELKNTSSLDISSLFRLPYERIPAIFKLNFLLYRMQLRKYLDWADIIWLTSPYFVAVVPKNLFSDKIVVYDCMDDYLEFPQISNSKYRYSYYLKSEDFLFRNASVVIASAKYLGNKLIARYGNRRISVINNAIKDIVDIEATVELPLSLERYVSSKCFKLVYIGTISSWLDFSLLQQIVKSNNLIEVFLFGPSEVTIPNSERITYCGQVEHNAVFKIMEMADALIMPFVVNELIQSVNPVKLYEYIYSGKPCLSPLYEESCYFEDYVYLYGSAEECISLLNAICSKKRKSKKDIYSCREFCEKNTWKHRMEEIFHLLDASNFA